MFRIEMLEANEGDALWIEYGDPDDPRRILIDCGYKSTYREVLKRMDKDKSLRFELFVLTHIDADHIAGAIPFIADKRVTPARIGDIWFNGREHLGPRDVMGAEQGEYFTSYIRKKKFRWNGQFSGKAVVIESGKALPVKKVNGGLTLTLLSPTRQKLTALAKAWDKELDRIMSGKNVTTVAELVALGSASSTPDVLGTDPPVVTLAARKFEADTKEPNGSSIAFLAEYVDEFDGGRAKAVLFTGDAHSPVVEESLRRLLAKRKRQKLTIDALKLSHHGSKKNTSSDLLGLLECRHFLFSTNGTKHNHPDAECVARVVAPKPLAGVDLHFNYTTTFNEIWKPAPLQKKFRYTAHYPAAGKRGLSVTI